MKCPCLEQHSDLVQSNKAYSLQLSRLVVTHADNKNLCNIAVVKLLADIAANFLDPDDIQLLASELYERAKPEGKSN